MIGRTGRIRVVVAVTLAAFAGFWAVLLSLASRYGQHAPFPLGWDVVLVVLLLMAMTGGVMVFVYLFGGRRGC